MIIFGTRIFGSTDRVTLGSERKPAFHVATKFFHVQFIPFVPLSSHLVLDFLQGNRAVSIPLSGKSIGIAWLRCISWWSALFLGIFSFALAGGDDFTWQLPLCFLVALGFASLVTWHAYFNDASYGRAVELLGHINLGPSFDAVLRRMIDESYISQFADCGQLEELVLALPTATAELVDEGAPTGASAPGGPDDLELCEATAVPSGDSDDGLHVPTAVARPSQDVAAGAIATTSPEDGFSQEQAKRGAGQGRENESQFTIV